MTTRKRKANKFIAKVASNIKYHRMKRNFSQEKLEDETGLTISRYESGNKDMTLTTIYILSEYLHVEPYKFLK
jgi:transcriptional regulator with XRE-family HTH domain